MNPVLYYCYDAYCGWCYGFSQVIQKVESAFRDQVSFEAVSGGMIPKDSAKHISAIAGFIRDHYGRVEERTGIRFGEDFLWHVKNPEMSDWQPHSETPAIALCILKEYHPQASIQFAAALQHSLYWEGRDLTDPEAYRHLLQRFDLPAADFFSKLQSEEYARKADQEFSWLSQLGVTGFPSVLLQTDENKLHLVANGYTDLESLQQRISDLLHQHKG